MHHMMGAGFGFFFGFLWLLVVVGFIVSWFILVHAVWRMMKTNERILEALSGMPRALVESHGISKDAGAQAAETVEKPEEQKEAGEK
jgi:divalent metal cation (Fe/Co/Zn/Cd) transporter